MPTQVQSTAEAATPFDPEILVRLSGSLKRVNEGFSPTVGARPAAASGARENVLVITAPQIKELSLSFTEASQSAQRGGYPSFSAPFQRVASSLEKMSSGMKGIVDAERVAGQLTKTGNVHIGAGAVAFTAGFISLFGGNGPDYSGPLSEIHTEIQALRQESQRHFRELAEGLLTHINGLKTTLSHVMENQQIILNAVNHALDGIDDIKTLLKEHVDTTGASFSHIATKDLREAHFKVQQYLEGTAANPDPTVIGDALDKLQFWLRTELKNPIINETQLSTVNSERMVSILNQQSPLNIPGLIAARLRFLFGNDILDEKYTRLPSLEVYQPTAACFLLGTQKSGLFGDNACQVMCEDINATLALYLDFINELSENKRLAEAICYRHEALQDDIAHVEYFNNSEIVPQKKLELQQKLLETTALMHSLKAISECGINRVSIDIDKYSHRMLLRTDQYPRRFKGDDWWGNRAVREIWFDELENSSRMQRYQSATDSLGIFLLSKNKCRIGAFHNNNEYIPEGMSPIDIDRVVLYPRSGMSFEYKSNRISSVITKRPAGTITPAILLLYLASGYGDTTNLRTRTPNNQVLRSLNCYFTNGKAASDFQILQIFDKKGRCVLQKNYDPSNTYDYGAVNFPIKEELPVDYEMILRSVETGGVLKLDKLKKAFEYYRLHWLGQVKEAQSDNVDPTCLLFLVAILGKWSIFEFYRRQTNLPDSFDYNQVIDDGSITPLMFAAQHGREDVVHGLMSKMEILDEYRRSFDNKTAAQLAFEQGFYNIAQLLKAGLSPQELQHCKSNLPIVSSSATIANQLVIDLAQMKEDVGSLQAAFKSQAESIAQAKVAASSAKAAIFVTRSEESDDDKELVLNEITNEELKPLQPLAWCKPRSTQAQEIGKRILPHTFFRNKREELRLTAELERHTFRVTPDIIDGEKCLVTFAKRDILNARA